MSCCLALGVYLSLGVEYSASEDKRASLDGSLENAASLSLASLSRRARRSVLPAYVEAYLAEVSEGVA